jgi:hypothetical protein
MSLGAILQGVGAAGSLFGAFNQGRKSFQGVNMAGLRGDLSDMKRLGQGFTDIGSDQNTQLRSLIMSMAANGAAQGNMLNQRNIAQGGGLSGIANANNLANVNRAQNQGSQNFLGAFQQNQGLGASLLSRYGENMAQARISNTAMRNQDRQASAGMFGNLGLGMLKNLIPQGD